MWINLPSELDPKIHFAFIYKITNLLNNRKYIGKKQLWVKKRKTIKGQKRKKVELVPSDYEKYWGSSKELLDDIEKYGINNFKREVLEIVGSKWEASYVELWYQMNENVIFSDDYYNGILNVRLPKPSKTLNIKDKYKKGAS